jgi:hypothetical protein
MTASLKLGVSRLPHIDSLALQALCIAISLPAYYRLKRKFSFMSMTPRKAIFSSSMEKQTLSGLCPSVQVPDASFAGFATTMVETNQELEEVQHTLEHNLTF